MKTLKQNYWVVIAVVVALFVAGPFGALAAFAVAMHFKHRAVKK